MRRTHYEQMLSELHPITDIERRRRQRTKFVIPATGGLLNSTVSSLIKLLFQPRRCAAQTCNDLLPNQYIRAVARPDQSGAGLFATARTLTVLSASLMSFASRLFFGALKTCLRLRPRSTSEGLVMLWGLIVSLVFVYVYPAIEMVEEWRLRRSAEKDRAQMRMHAASGHRWDVTRGQWVA